MKRVFLYWLLILFLCISCGVSRSVRHTPNLDNYSTNPPEVVRIDDSTFYADKAFVTKNQQQQWELYLEGDPLQLGYQHGGLMQSLVQQQEKYFFSRVADFVPSRFKQKMLSGFLKWYNRKMYLHVSNDYQAEIYGLSHYSSDKYDDVAPRFLRNMYLHGAHDIGHALQDMMMVGCSSLAVWDENSEDGSLLIGRNFDFYVSDDFAENKVVQFVRPSKGIPYVSISWPGMTGVVSGMNYDGLTVTINAAKSKIPLAAKTPISLLTKEILQFSTTIEEAITIAKKRQVFVSESIIIGSAKDRRAIIIEVAPANFGVYEVPNSTHLICTNHFQSQVYQQESRNLSQIREGVSSYRYEKLQELLQQEKKLNTKEMADILRNREGLNARSIGYGNEKALNQLLAHHSVIFSPEQKKIWVSSKPYQLGEMVCYDLNDIFGAQPKPGKLSTPAFNIPRSPFADSEEFLNYERFKKVSLTIDSAIRNKTTLDEALLQNFINLNPDFWLSYFKVGQYFFTQKNYSEAEVYFGRATQREITRVSDRNNTESYLRKTRRRNRGFEKQATRDHSDSVHVKSLKKLP
ncbi:C45 family autoproteolytic acyltransferase/hydrolase [Sphingobacterium oryzagri]|uniref:C45 family autoproteolytic acyltransferase/hydrolase n=1 Tax=Sphingobacterium oryzagri TaxID=3025669 RepID=A0ABY7WCC3_9SPHI|nr:C45 family peptidase [Sphingobacterium sp. KACC 22765]WDF66848.1 C45 family autoproteolytic acyltransferase/hydrolase [Sphingobacterium sp. KACC 22765]